MVFDLSSSTHLSLVEKIQQALDHCHQTDLVMLDFSKAFDTIPHQSRARGRKIELVRPLKLL